MSGEGDQDEEFLSSDDSEYEDMDDEDEEQAKVYLPGIGVDEGEELVCDKSAYKLYQQASTGSPCLSFDIIPDDDESKKDKYPAQIYAVGGSQAESAKGNQIIAFKMSNLHHIESKERNDSEDEESSDEEEDLEKRPLFESAMRQHRGGVNRLRCTKFQGKQLVATWSEHGSVHIWDIKAQMHALKSSSAMNNYKKDQKKVEPPLFTFEGYMTEGFAMDWSKQGALLTGDCKNNIFLLNPSEDRWSFDQRPFSGHEGSVEEVLWSPTESSVFTSCSADASIRFWDTRSKSNKLMIKSAHESDVNVMSWNQDGMYILSGGDDGMIKLWDLRQVAKDKPKSVSTFKHHTAPITSVEWNPNDRSVFAAAGADDQLTLWDLGVEKDESAGSEELKDVPDQLLFIHQGQKDIKELHWHKQYPGMIISTALDGFNIFRSISA